MSTQVTGLSRTRICKLMDGFAIDEMTDLFPFATRHETSEGSEAS